MHHHHSFLAALIIIVALCAVAGKAQTTLNPDLSLVGDMRAYSHNDPSRADEKGKFSLTDPQMEIMVAGYLNPYASADAVVAWHPGANAEVEEIYASILRGLPLGLSLKAGKYLLDFGRLNPEHEHAWPFTERPLPHEAFFGEEGLNDVAVRASLLLPTGNVYTEAMAAVLKGDALAGHHHSDAEEHEEESTSERVDPGFFGRLTSSFAVSEYGELAVGASIVNAVAGSHEQETEDETELAKLASSLSDDEDHESLRVWIGGVDVKYKHKRTRYSSLQIEGEALFRRDEQYHGGHLTSYGGYAYLDYRFLQKYNAGGIFEFVRQKECVHVEETGASEITQQDTWRAGLFTGFAPIEETSLLRLVGYWTKPEDSDGFWEVTLQFVFSLGPHKAHNF